MRTRQPDTRRSILILVIATCMLYGILYAVSTWLTSIGQGDMALILFIGGGVAVLGLAAHLFRDVLKPPSREKPISERDPFMAALAGKSRPEPSEPSDSSSSRDDG